MDSQEAAIRSEGPVLVIAGPGTGKTWTMIHRALYLICEKKVKPEEIMMVTYTVKASKELITRLTGELADRGVEVNLHEMYIGTFHHICRRILKEFREYTSLTRNHRETDQFEQQYLVYSALPEFEKIPRFEDVVPSFYYTQEGGKRTISKWKRARKVCDYVNGLSEELLDPEELIREHGGEMGGRVEVLGRMMLRYDRLSREKNFTDFSRLQTETYRLLTRHPEILRKFRSRIRYVMVDEYQDTDFIEEQLIRLFCGERGSLFVVGDDDQSLYRFRGATVENILRFKEHFGGRCQQYFLTTNHRSNAGIIDFCMRWMAYPTLFSWTDGSGRSYRYRKGRQQASRIEKGRSVVKITAVNDPKAWGDRVASCILKLKADGCITDFNQVALLFDSVKGKPSVTLQDALTRHGIPVYAPRAGRFFERKEICLFLGILLLLFPGFSAHMDKFPELDETEGITEQYMIFMAMAQEALELPRNGELALWEKKKVREIKKNKDGTLDLMALLYEILSLPPFRGWMEEAAQGESAEARNLSAVTRLVSRFGYFLAANHGYGRETVADVHLFFSRYLRLWYENGVGEYEDEEAYAPSGSVSFLNIHQSKGLEYPVVMVAGLTDYPRWQDNLVEEVSHLVKQESFYEPPRLTKYFDFQRKYYTAFSRAETLLVLTCNIEKNKAPTSAFIPALGYLPEYDESMDFRGLTFRPVDKNHFKPRFAFTTQVALYEECPLKYKFLRVYHFAPSKGRAALYGLLVHETIEDVHRAVLAGEASAVTPGAVYGWMMTDYVTLSQTENTWLSQEELDSAFHEALDYAMMRSRHPEEVEAAEYPLELVKPDYIMDGTIDLLAGCGGVTDVIDFKTGKKPSMDSSLMERYESQLMVYAYLVEQKTDKKVGRLILYFTGDPDPMVVFPMDREKVERRIASFDGTVRRIMAGDFCHKAERKGKEQPEACRYCGWNRFCWGEE